MQTISEFNDYFSNGASDTRMCEYSTNALHLVGRYGAQSLRIAKACRFLTYTNPTSLVLNTPYDNCAIGVKHLRLERVFVNNIDALLTWPLERLELDNVIFTEWGRTVVYRLKAKGVCVTIDLPRESVFGEYYNFTVRIDGDKLKDNTLNLDDLYKEYSFIHSLELNDLIEIKGSFKKFPYLKKIAFNTYLGDGEVLKNLPLELTLLAYRDCESFKKTQHYILKYKKLVGFSGHDTSNNVHATLVKRGVFPY